MSTHSDDHDHPPADAATGRLLGWCVFQEILVVSGNLTAAFIASSLTLYADSAKARRELGWQVKFPNIDAIVGTAWRWHEAHPEGYADRTGK